MEQARLICLTPVKNESWILDIFLTQASTWADIIIVVDQNSSDDSKEMYKKYSKVKVINNTDETYDENKRQKILIDAAREIAGHNIFITLDADEVLTVNAQDKSEWDAIRRLEPGTILNFEWINFLPQKNLYWQSGLKPFGYIDDGSTHQGSKIHSTRIPTPEIKKSIRVKNIKVIHLQYAHWDRMLSKHRWYQCWERINKPHKNPLVIYRQYHHMFSIKKRKFKNIPPEWISVELKESINKAISQEKLYYWDKDVLLFMLQYGKKTFSKIDIWDIDWVKKLKNYNIITDQDFSDPRNKFEKNFFKYLKRTQYYSKALLIKITDFILQFLFRF